MVTVSNRELTRGFAVKVFPKEMKTSLGLSYSQVSQGSGCPWVSIQPGSSFSGPSFAHTEVPEDDVQDLLGAPSTVEAGQVSPGDAQRLGCQGYICSLLVVAKGIQATLEVMLVPCPRQKWWACGWVPTPARDKEHGLS